MIASGRWYIHFISPWRWQYCVPVQSMPSLMPWNNNGRWYDVKSMLLMILHKWFVPIVPTRRSTMHGKHNRLCTFDDCMCIIIIIIVYVSICFVRMKKIKDGNIRSDGNNEQRWTIYSPSRMQQQWQWHYRCIHVSTTPTMALMRPRYGITTCPQHRIV